MAKFEPRGFPFVTRSLESDKVLQASHAEVVRHIREPKNIIHLNPFVVSSVVENPHKDPDLYTITEKPLFFGIPMTIVFKARFTNVDNGISCEVCFLLHKSDPLVEFQVGVSWHGNADEKRMDL
jgi:hypothetical protein